MNSYSLKTEFGRNSLLYEEARPGYPNSIIEEVIKLSAIPEGGSVLDIGCGSGKSTLPFGERGYRIMGTDLSEELVAIARQKSAKFSNVSYVIGEFEQMILEGPFDLIVSGQALHWIEPEVGYKKIVDILKNSGTLAAFWNFENYEAEGLAEKVRGLYLKHCPACPIDLGSSRRYIDKLDASRLFAPVLVNTHYWNCDFTKESYVKLAKSWAWVSSLPDEDSRRVLEGISQLLEQEPDSFSIPFKTVLLITQKKQE